MTKDLLLTLLTMNRRCRGRAAARSPRDNAAYRAAIIFAWLFLLRAGEYSDTTNRHGEVRFCVLRLGDLALYRGDGAVCCLDDTDSATAVSIALRGSKTDQARTGCVRSLKATGGPIDPVAAVRDLLGLYSTLELASPQTPLFCLDSGRPVSSLEITAELRAAAVALGLEPSRYATHSLRRGGATALVAAGVESEVVRRWGRWLSDTWRRYIFGTVESLGDLATDMVSADYTVSMAIEDFRASVPRAAA